MSNQAKQGGASLDAIQHHYDIGNQFYSYFLDNKMVYSCALWNEGDDLEQAQLNKLDYHLVESNAKSQSNLLDIGCGWGALMERARANYDVENVVGLTLSEAQVHYIDNLKLNNIETRLESWEDHVPKTKYDAIISIGAFEHFAKPELLSNEKIERYRVFFSKCHEWLQPGGHMSLQTISYDNMARENMSKFIVDEIFPESDLPKLYELVEASDGLFSIIRLRNDAQHYKETCRHWLSRLRSNRDKIESLVGKEKYDTYAKYLSMVTIGFHTKNMGLIRVTLKRLDKPYWKI